MREEDRYSSSKYNFDRDCQEYDFLSFEELNDYLSTMDYSSSENVMAMIFAIGIYFQSEYSVGKTSAWPDVNVFIEKLGYADATLVWGDNPDFIKFLKKNMELNWPVMMSIKDSEASDSHITMITKYDKETNQYYFPEYQGYYSLDELPLKYNEILRGIFNLHLELP